MFVFWRCASLELWRARERRAPRLTEGESALAELVTPEHHRTLDQREPKTNNERFGKFSVPVTW